MLNPVGVVVRFFQISSAINDGTKDYTIKFAQSLGHLSTDWGNWDVYISRKNKKLNRFKRKLKFGGEYGKQ
jgi:hypothetical protein